MPTMAYYIVNTAVVHRGTARRRPGKPARSGLVLGPGVNLSIWRPRKGKLLHTVGATRLSVTALPVTRAFHEAYAANSLARYQNSGIPRALFPVEVSAG